MNLAMSLTQAVVIALLFVLIVWPCGRILRKAGFSPWWAIVVLIPLANWALLLFLAFARWPALERPDR